MPYNNYHLEKNKCETCWLKRVRPEIYSRLKCVVNYKCRVCDRPATCHIYKEKEIIHLCLEHYREKEEKW